LVVLLVACTQTELCEETEHPHRISTMFSFNWVNATSDEYVHTVPDTMNVLAKRIVGTWKCLIQMDSYKAEGYYLWNAPEELPEGKTTEFRLRSGIYKLLAFNRDDKEFIYDDIDNYIRTDDGDKQVSDLNIEYKRYSYDDPELRGTISYWKDYNNYGGSANYIQPDITPIYYDSITPIRVDDQDLSNYVFKPNLLSQNIDVKFHIHKKVDVVPFIIDSVYTEISGIPCRVNLANGYIDVTETCKMLYKNHFRDATGKRIKDTNKNTELECHGTIDVLSVVNAPDEKVTYGPGILQVMIFVKNRSMPIRGKVNLYYPIRRANLYELTEDGLHAIRHKRHGTIDIEANLIIDENFLVTSDDESGFERWISTDETDVIDI
jgi:hypothetical protein